jgi:thiamine biosynthesis lipoprotein
LTDFASFPAWGSTATVVATDSERLPEAVRAVQRVLEDFDLACSRFRDDSELIAINRASGRSIKVSPLMVEATLAGVRAAWLTDGDVDPTLGSALVALGYDRDFGLGLGGRGAGADPAGSGEPPGSGNLDGSGDPAGSRDPAGSGEPPGSGNLDGSGDPAGSRDLAGTRAFAAVPGWRTIRVDPEASTVGVGQGVSLDLGATAKALAADHGAREARQAAGCGVLVNLGGDLAIAAPAPDDGWRVRVTDDHRSGPEAPGQWIAIAGGGLATSSTAVRRWRDGEGETVHHLLDPATGRPAGGGWRTVSVAAATCLDANIATTAAIVRGDRAPDWLRSLALPARLVSDQGLALHVAGWPEPGEDLEPLTGPLGEVPA